MLVTFLLQILVLQSPGVVMDLCSAVDMTKPAVITLRAVGGKSAEGPILFEYTCPVARGNDFVLPTVVLITNPKFTDAQSSERFRVLGTKQVFQALVEGRLECRKPFNVVRSDDGDIVAANGYGPMGLYNCILREGRFLLFHVIEQ